MGSRCVWPKSCLARLASFDALLNFAQASTHALWSRSSMRALMMTVICIVVCVDSKEAVNMFQTHLPGVDLSLHSHTIQVTMRACRFAKERKIEEVMPAPEYIADLLSLKRAAALRQQADSSSNKKFLGQLCFGVSSTRGNKPMWLHCLCITSHQIHCPQHHLLGSVPSCVKLQIDLLSTDVCCQQDCGDQNKST